MYGVLQGIYGVLLGTYRVYSLGLGFRVWTLGFRILRLFHWKLSRGKGGTHRI